MAISQQWAGSDVFGSHCQQWSRNHNTGLCWDHISISGLVAPLDGPVPAIRPHWEPTFPAQGRQSSNRPSGSQKKDVWYYLKRRMALPLRHGRYRIPTCQRRVITQAADANLLSSTDLNPRPQTLNAAVTRGGDDGHPHVYQDGLFLVTHRLVVPWSENMALPFMRRSSPLQRAPCPEPFLMWGHFDSNWMIVSSCRPHKPGHFVPAAFDLDL